MFNYYDNRMHRRISYLKKSNHDNTEMLDGILNMTKRVVEYMAWEEKVNSYKEEQFYSKNDQTTFRG